MPYMPLPKTLDEAIVELIRWCKPSDLIKFKIESEENSLAWYHHSLGRDLRNNWGLWNGGNLAKHFNTLGISHADDMSGIILTTLHRILNRKPVYLKNQIEYYQDYWERANTCTSIFNERDDGALGLGEGVIM